MNHKLLKRVSLACMLSVTAFAAQAQVLTPPAFPYSNADGTVDNNYYANYVGIRMAVTEPAAIVGNLTYEPSGTWGGAINSVDNQPVVKAAPYDACTAITNAAAINGKWALIQRGTCDFSAKALAAQTAGAVGVIIVNNIPGGPVGMAGGAVGASVTIPVVMISDVDGAAIAAQLDASTPVEISFTAWGIGTANDLGFVPQGAALWHAYAVPSFQLGNDNGNPSAYKGIHAAYIANFGTDNQTGVTVEQDITFTPAAGGTPTDVVSRTSTVGTFNADDSILVAYSADLYDIHATQPGRFDVEFNIDAAAADANTTDNTMSYSFYASDSIFSKARYDFAAGEPIGTIGYQTGGTNPAFAWGPLYYSAVSGGRNIEKLQFSVSKEGVTGNLAGQPDFSLYVFKWVDGASELPVDSVMEAGELTLLGVANYEFTTLDSSFDFLTADVRDINNPANMVPLENDTWYWVACDMPSGWFLVCDGELNYLPRTYARYNQTGANYREEYWAPLVGGSPLDLTDPGTTPPDASLPMIPFDNQRIDSTRFSNQKDGLVPSIAMHVSGSPVSVKEVKATTFSNLSVFPNPATDKLTVSVNLSKSSDRNSISIIDGMGKSVYRTTIANLHNSQFDLPISNLAAGQYYVTVSTTQGTRVIPFTIIAK